MLQHRGAARSADACASQKGAVMLHQGSCHCGKIAYEVEVALDKVISCNCSHCSKKGYLLAFAPRGALRLKTPEDAMATYTFNTHRIRHRFCPTCGCAPFGEGTSPSGEETAAINVRCLEGVELDKLTIVQVDGRST
jgi:hypothetical protein